MKESKFIISSKIIINHNSSWSEKALKLLAKDILTGVNLNKYWDTRKISFSTQINKIEKA